MSNDLSVNMRRAEADRQHYEASRRAQGIREAIAGQRVEIPRPHVPYGPLGFPMNTADADYLRSAVRNIRQAEHNGHGLFGSNLTNTVCKLLEDTAAAIESGPEPTNSGSGVDDA